MKKAGWKALIPIGVFLLIYLGLGLTFEYGMGIPQGFYQVPIVGAFLAAILVACLILRGRTGEEKLRIMAGGAGDPNIITMVLIFLAAGAFVGVVGRSGAESVAYFMLSLIPPRFAVAVLFVVSCLIATAMGTSVGTITLLTPIAVEIAAASGHPAALCIATVVGGAMFGDNLSLISDTTIAACNGQGCPMKDKFRGNVGIALPAAVCTVALLLILTAGKPCNPVEGEFDLLLMLPYLLVLICGVAGMNVFAVLLLGIGAGAVMVPATGSLAVEPGHNALSQLLANVGGNMAGMYETCMVALLVAALGALIREGGGFDALLTGAQRVFRGRRGGQVGIGLLVAAMDAATANNTVAIVMANPIARDMSRAYGITPRRTACLLDTFSCIAQGVIPYGAQLLVAVSTAAKMGCSVSALELVPLMYYQAFLLLCSLAAILLPQGRRAA